MSTGTKQPPYVFISYSQESDEHVGRVVKLATWLREHGVEAWIDQWETSPPEGWGLWCYRQIQKASFVLVVCTETYRRRALREEEPDVGRGVTWEGQIITSQLYDRTAGDSKFIPVGFTAADLKEIPFYLAEQTNYLLDDDEASLDLFRALTGQRKYLPTPLGQLKVLPPESDPGPQPVVSPPAGPPPAQLQLGDVVDGSWLVEIEIPFMPNQIMRINLTTDGFGQRTFAAEAIVGPAGWQATGQWELLGPDGLRVAGTQFMPVPFPQTGPYQDYFRFSSLSRQVLIGTDFASRGATWRRE